MVRWTSKRLKIIKKSNSKLSTTDNGEQTVTKETPSKLEMASSNKKSIIHKQR